MEDLALLEGLEIQGLDTQRLAVDPQTQEVAEQAGLQQVQVPDSLYGLGDLAAIQMGVAVEVGAGPTAGASGSGTAKSGRKRGRAADVTDTGKRVSGQRSPKKKAREEGSGKAVPSFSQLASAQQEVPSHVPGKQRMGEWGCITPDMQRAIEADAQHLSPEMLMIRHNGPADNRALARASVFKAYQVLLEVEKREKEMALQENYYKLQQAHDYLKGEHKRLNREKDRWEKKYEKLREQSKKEEELAAAQNAALEMKVSQIPELEKQVADLRAETIMLGDRVTDLAIQEAEAGPKAVRTYLESPDHQAELKRERESFMQRKIREWAGFGWLDLRKMMVEAGQKAEEEKAQLAAASSREMPPMPELDGEPASPSEGQGDEEVAGEEEEAQPEEPTEATTRMEEEEEAEDEFDDLEGLD